MSGHYLIKEWDGSVNGVWVRKADNPGSVLNPYYRIMYSDGMAHEVKESCLKGMIIRPMTSGEINNH